MYYIADNSFSGDCAELVMKNVNYDNFFDVHL